MDKIKVEFKRDSPYSEYGYYKKGDTGYVVGYTQGCAVILMDDGSFVKAGLDWIKEVFQKLVEDEVEEIREELISIVKEHGCKYQLDMSDYISYIEKQGEQKPVEWSEEDEKMLGSIIVDCSYIGDFPDYPTKEESELYDECLEKVDWLKSLKDRCLPQPKQEWSNEDKAILDSLIRKLEGEDIYVSNHIALKFLKNLIPQKQWKPSEEQIEAVEKTLSLAKNCGEEYSFDLRKLLEQLKAL